MTNATEIKPMWNPDVPLKQWLAMYPDLRTVLPFHCACGKELSAIPYVSSEWVGLESTTCQCDLGESFCAGFPKNKLENQAAKAALIALHNEYLGHGEPV